MIFLRKRTIPIISTACPSSPFRLTNSSDATIQAAATAESEGEGTDLIKFMDLIIRLNLVYLHRKWDNIEV